MVAIGRVLGGIVLLVWLLHIPLGRNYIRRRGSVMYATVFQYHILLLLLGIGLLIWGNLWYLLIASLAWVLSTFFPRFFLFVFPDTVGLAYGYMLFSDMFPESQWWPLGGGLIGIVSMFAVCTIVVAIVTSPRPQTIPAGIDRAIESLNDILKCLFAALLDRYYSKFPEDDRETNLTRAGVVLNELVGADLKGEEVRFRQANAEFIDREKAEVMNEDDVRTGVLAFLAAKGGLYQSWGHSDAQKWIRKAEMLDPEVDIPGTLTEIQEAIDGCLARYGQMPGDRAASPELL